MRTSLLRLILLAVLLLSAAPTLSQAPPNLLGNPGFEGDYYPWNGYQTAQVPHDGWTPWWDPGYRMPEWKPAEAADFPYRVLGGATAAQWFTFHSRHDAGMYQQVHGVVPGQTYRFSIWAQVWSSVEDEPRQSVNPSNPRLRIGIDPFGNTNAGPNRPPASVVWSPEASMDSIIDQWGFLSIEVVAQNSTITVYMRSNPDFATEHNDMYWDNASLVQVGPPPTSTPVPTDTPLPATDTPIATATFTPAPATNTPVPTDTPVATETPLPTEMPEPTETAEPTNTPPPTDTPAPTEVPATNTPRPSPTSAPTDEPTPVDEEPAATAIAANPTATSPVVGEAEEAEEAAPPEETGFLCFGPLALLPPIGFLLFRRRRFRTG